jgi:hypothetical protein
MPTYDSPLGETKITGNTLKEMDVPDESEYSKSQGQVFAPSVTKRYGNPHLDEAAIRDFQAKMQSFDNEVDPETERQMKAARDAKRAGRERLNDSARKRIEMLIDMTRGRHTVEIEGQSYSFNTLKAKEMREAIFEASKFDGTTDSPFEIRRQLLARSLVQVVGIDVDQFMGSNKLEDRLYLVDQMDDALLNVLYAEYIKMVDENKGKYSIKSDADVKEIVEDLKK